MSVDIGSPRPGTSVHYRKRKPVPSSAFESLPYDVQEEIECLYEFVPEVTEHFEVLDKIGEGTFSSVFLARLKNFPEVQQLFALKHIIPTSHPSRIEAELKCLLQIGGEDNVMGVELCLRNKDHVVIVMKYFPHERFQDYILRMRFDEVRDYIKNLLIALRQVHKFDIIHRDVKPSNFLWDRKNKQYALVDFGLAHKAALCKMTDSENAGFTLPVPPTAVNKGVLTPSNTQNYSHKHQDKGASTGLKPYTPPTPGSGSAVFAKRVKSPRRLLLAKRALLVSQSKSAVLAPQSGTCQCFGKPQICSLCSARSQQQAARAGTPGFRSPEVLIKCPDQSTAVDIWSAGVIFLSMLSGRYPFFRANDDLAALAQIISTMGSEEMKQAAKICGKNLTCSPATCALDLKTLCIKLRAGPMSRSQRPRDKMDEHTSRLVEKSWRSIPDSAFDLLGRLLDLNPYTRISAADALDHKFFTEDLRL